MNVNQNIVSVCMLTYNHEAYIEDAINGVLKQKTNFKIELIIGEDCSTDNTRKICLDYQNKYPQIIKLFYPQKNIGAIQNSIETLNKCTSKYIAMCEGDDYWTDPYKLQKQVDFMEANLDYSIVYHRVDTFNETSKTFRPEEHNKSEKEQTYTIEDLAIKNFIHTPSVLLRTSSIDFNILSEYSSVVMDYFLWMICARSGKIKYFPNKMAVYRVWDGSVWELRSIEVKYTALLKLLISLLRIFSNNQTIFDILFTNIKDKYKYLYNISKFNLIAFDDVTKKLLLNKDFQSWWFSYMIHMKESKRNRLKYYFYLLSKKDLISYRLITKCIY